MTTMKRVLCVLLSLIMVFGSVSLSAFAAENEITYSYKYYTEKDDSYNADISLDKADEFLKANKDSLYYELKQSGLFGGEKVILTIDLTSIDAICKTIDDYKGILTVSGFLMGDLKDLEFSTWQTGMSRSKTDDITIIKELIELVNANRSLVEKVCSGEADLGLANAFFDINALLGEDGISGFVKGLLVDLVYDKEENPDQYNAAYARAKNDIDSFIFTDLLYELVTDEDGYLPGFTMDKNSTVEDIVIVGFGLVIDKYIAPALKDFNVDLTAYGEDLKALSSLVNLKGDTYDFSKVRFSEDSSLLTQINDVIGEIAKQLVPSYTAWEKGDYTLIESNLEGVFRYLAEGSGLIENADTLSYEELMFEVIALILEKTGFDEGIESCKNFEELASRILINAANELHIGVDYSGSESYLVVLGDIVAWFLYDYIKLTDLYGREYVAGGGKDIWEVLNYALNYVFFEKDVAGFTGISVSKTDSLFTKIDKFIDCFGENKQVNFDSKQLLMGDGTQKGLIDSVFTLDLQNIIDITAVKVLNCAGDVPVLEFLYKTVMHMMNNWSGTQMIPAFQQTRPLNNALENSNVSKMVKDAIYTLNERKDYAVPLVVFIAALIFKADASAYSSEIVVDASQTAGAAPSVSVKFAGRTLAKGKDYIMFSESSDDGLQTLTFKFTDNYQGSASVPVLAKPEGLAAKAQGSEIKLTWNAVAGATEYEVYRSEDGGMFTKIAVAADTEYTFSGEAGSSYSFKLRPIAKNGVAVSYGVYSDEAAVKTAPKKVTNLSCSSKTASSATLKWSAVSGADRYVVYMYKNGKWEKVKTTTSNSYTVKNLAANTKYYFRVRSYSSGVKLYGDTSSTLSVTTNLNIVKTVKAKNIKSNSVTVYWSKVSGATTYLVYRYIGGEWVRVGKTSATSLKVTSLKANKNYYFRVRPYSSKTKVYGDYSSNLKVVTVPDTVKKPKTSSVKTNSLKLSWSAVSGATAYQIYRSTDGKNWSRVASVKSKYTSYTDKTVKKNKKYYYKVRAYRKVSDKVYYGAFSSAVKVQTPKK